MMDFKSRMSRYKKIKTLTRQGKGLKQIGEKFGISRERVRQILLKEPKDFGYVKREWLGFSAPPKGRERTRELVRIRDLHTCQDCNKKWQMGQRRFDVHHLNGLCGKKSRGYDSVKDMDGLITLCHKCHYNRPEHTLQRKKNRYEKPPVNSGGFSML